jgi:hypothetical protein
MPVRSLIYRFKKEIDEESNDKYYDVSLSFPSDYDKESHGPASKTYGLATTMFTVLSCG